MSSHRSRSAETRAMPPNSANVSIPRIAKQTRPTADNYTTRLPQRTSITSVGSSSGRRSSGSMDSSTKSVQTRPSALPRSSSATSQTKLAAIASSRATPTTSAKASVSQTLRHLETSKDSPTSDNSRTGTTREPNFNFDFQTQYSHASDENVVPSTENSQKRRSRSGFAPTPPSGPLPPRLIPELQALAATNRPLPPPPSSSLGSIISSPSTVFTTSPSPWSASTTTTTPVSWSSASPCIVQPAHPQQSGKRSQTVPVPAAVRSKLPKLPVLKENQPQPSSSSQVELKEEPKPLRKKLRKTPLNSPAPTPPPRSSSARSRSNSKSSLQSKNESCNLPPVPTTTEDSPLARHGGTQFDRVGQDLDLKNSNQGHTRLQEAINFPPARPSRDGAESVGARSNEPVNTNILHYGARRQLLDAAPVGSSTHRRQTSQEQDKNKAEAEKQPPKQSARSRLAKFSKLALFGRSRETNVSEANASKESASKEARKGPVAGTGHEGYGKFVRRTRKSSVNSNSAAVESEGSVKSAVRYHQRKESGKSSRRASGSQSDLDDFASSRMKPVVLVGGSQRGQPSSTPEPEVPAKLSDISLDSVASTTAVPVIYAEPLLERHSLAIQTSDGWPTLAERRSQKFANADETFRLPDPIDTKNLIAPPGLDSQNTTYSSEIPTSAAFSESGSDMYRVDPYLLDKQRKKSKKLKWNMFGKKSDDVADSLPYVEPTFQPVQSPELPVSISQIPMSKPMPYYAMLGSDLEITTTETIGQYLNEAAHSPKSPQPLDIDYSPEELSPERTRVESVLLPSAPERKYYAEETPQLLENVQPVFVPQEQDSPYDSDFDFPLPPESRVSPPAEEPTPPVTSERKPRQPRLAQVGRIPKVVPRSQKVDVPKPQTLNRPTEQFGFGRRNPVIENPVPKEEPRRKLAPKLATESLRNQVLFTVPEAEGDSTPTNPNIPAVQMSEHGPQQDFLKFADPRNSDFTTSSSSDGVITIMGPPSSTKPTAKFQHSHAYHEDDVWNEYDDFIDRVMSPPGLQYANKDLLDVPAPLQTLTSARYSGKGKGLAILPPLLTQHGPSQPLPTPPYLNSSSPSLQEMASSEEMRLRRSRIAAALHSSSHASFDPSSPFSMRDFIAEYSHRDSAKASERLSSSTAGVQSPAKLVELTPEPDSKQFENAAHIDDVQRTKNPVKHSELSYASLMVSRWLSFGRVLFSPAHTEIENQPERHVLVIDGLGSEDWSIYCAVNYQSEKAFVHDLKERQPTRRGSQASRTSDSVPSNHRRAEVGSLNDRFPFPPSFFSVVVVRFPPMMAESKLRNIMTECRRVLAPGGYLEMMVLELDINNMGVTTRRAVKDLKIKMATLNREISLKPIIDNTQTVLNSRGFSNVKSCVVGVPVVGRPISSTGSTSSSLSSGSPVKRSSAGPRPFENLNMHQGFSLNDLVADHSENADAKIGRMVSKTARSWWQHCFEASVISDGNLKKSVFANKDIVKECKSRASSFKLLIAYAQKPGMEQKRRTLSEPLVPTLAMAGLPRNPKPTK